MWIHHRHRDHSNRLHRRPSLTRTEWRVMAMASQSTRDIVWEQKFRIEQLIRYYASSNSMRSKIQTLILIVTLVASAGAVLALLDDLERIVGLAAASLVSLLSIISAIWNNPSKVSVIVAVGERCREIGIESNDLWNNIDVIDDDAAIEIWKEIELEIEHATSPVAQAGVGFSARRVEKAAIEARESMKWSAAPRTHPG